jgi:hypothetical protein
MPSPYLEFLACHGQERSCGGRRARCQGMRAVLGVEHTVIEGVDLERAGTEEVVVARVRPVRSRRNRCGRRAPGYDQGEGRRCWRGREGIVNLFGLTSGGDHSVRG